MSDSLELVSGHALSSAQNTDRLPISSIVRAVCEAANGGPELLYEVMIKMSLMVEATAPTYGLSIWSASLGDRPSLRWAEGLEENEIEGGEKAVAEVLVPDSARQAQEGDQAICLVLALPTAFREGAALYGRCVRPLSNEQANELNALGDVAQLAHAHQLTRAATPSGLASSAKLPPPNGLPGMVFKSRAMTEVAR